MSIKIRPWFCHALIIFSFGLALPGGLTEAVEQANRPEGRLVITGASNMCTMIDAMGMRFQALHRNVQVEVQCGGSIRGLRDLDEGKSHIAMVSRPLAGKEKNLYGFPIARDGVSIVVHKNNPVRSLSNALVADIFTGRTGNWKNAGGLNAPVAVMLREQQKVVTELFIGYYKLRWTELKGKVLVGDNPVTIDALASNRQAIAYVSSGYAEHEAAMGRPIKILPVNNIMPTRRNIITGNYPISRPLMLVTAKLPTGPAKEFIDFALSSSVVDIIERYGYVPYQD